MKYFKFIIFWNKLNEIGWIFQLPKPIREPPPSDDFDDDDDNNNITLEDLSSVDTDTEMSSDDENSDGDSDNDSDSDAGTHEFQRNTDFQSDVGESSVKIHMRKRRKLNNVSDFDAAQNGSANE